MVILAFLLLGAAGVFYWTSENVNHGVYWANRICTSAHQFCDTPWWLLVGAGAVGLVSLIVRMTKT